jgi:hypothetical protein
MTNITNQQESSAGKTALTHPYSRLTPDLVMDAIEANGFLTDARIIALNSYDTLNVYM